MLIVFISNQPKLCITILIGILITKSLFADSIDISHNYPKEVKSGSEFKIEIKISKQELSSFAKLEYHLPIGFTAKEDISTNAKFIFDNGKAKLIWDRLPDTSEFSLSFIIITKSNLQGIKSINGSFSYVDKEERKSIDLNTLDIEIKQNKKEISDPIKQNQIGYRLQIAASTRKISINELKKTFNIHNDIREEVHNGMYKYTTGSYPSYADAKKELHKLITINKVPGAFLTAYINNSRTTLKNAFSLTK